MKKKKFIIDIIIPIYNEGKNLKKILNLFEKNINFPYLVYICYDKKNEPGLKYIDPLKKNIFKIKNNKSGPNHAILKGIKAGKSENVLVYMADDFENIKLINKMIKLGSNYDLIVPSRYVKGGVFENAKFFKKLITDTASIVINKILRIPVMDNTNAFKFFKRKILKRINFVSTIGFTFALELTIKSYFEGFRIKEIPCVWRDLTGRKSNFKVIEWLPSYALWLFYIVKFHIIRIFFK